MNEKRRSPAVWRRPDVYAGLMFIGIASLGLYLSANYAMGTAVRMGTGYVPRLLCWALLALGVIIFLQGLLISVSAKEAFGKHDVTILRPLILLTLAVVVFALSIETLGFIIAMLATILVGSFATRSLSWLEAIVAMILLTLTCWGIFSYGLALPFPVWPRY